MRTMTGGVDCMHRCISPRSPVILRLIDLRAAAKFVTKAAGKLAAAGVLMPDLGHSIIASDSNTVVEHFWPEVIYYNKTWPQEQY
jgi:hypothetical protein